ncbi:MAG: DUF2357 domain-containing protein [Bacteroidetes bacterium]|nr:DUF2357 domain-containing protein [Bacteroidota bacterium]
MIEVKEKLEIPLDHINDQMKMIIYPNMKGENLLLIEDDYKRYNEAKFQVFEGKKYLYELINAGNWFIDTEKAAGTFTKIKDGDIGGFNPNTFVGTFQIPFIHRLTQEIKYEFIEIRSTKISYEKGISDSDFQSERSEYQEMVKDIAEQSIDLVLQYNIPIQQSYESGLEQLDDEKQLYQRFLFVRSLFKNEEFEEAVQKIISNPATKWETELEARDVRSIRRFTPKNIRELVSGPNRMNLSSSIGDLKSIPTKISSNRKVESVDTPENRFIKHILTSFQDFCEAILPKLTRAKLTRESEEVQSFAQRLDNLLNQPFFKEINRPNSLKLNSPVLQRRSGYRELLRAWLRFHVTAQLSWNPENEENLFAGGKKDIASLYEYWVFFVLFELLSENYGKNTTKDPNQLIDGLIVPDKHGLALTLQEGKKRAFKFTHRSDKRNLNIQFYYNRSFVGGKAYDKDKSAGSYSKAFRPDYTLSIWPSDLSQTMAEETESIVHIHFDAKYKVEYSFLKEEKPEEGEEIIVADSENLSDEEKQSLEEERASASINVREKEEKKGIYKNVDLYKMHAYKDAIRRSGGAYILYPGNAKDNKEFKGFHEIIPGVGAFALRPNNEGQASENIQEFIEKVIKNLEDVLSQRERMARATKKVYDQKPIQKISDSKLEALLRELGQEEHPEETQVLVGYYKGESHLNWIQANAKYNIRYGTGYTIDGKMILAKYLVLYGEKDMQHAFIYRLNNEKGKICSKKELLEFKPTKYPSTPTSDHYFLFDLGVQITLDAFKFDKENQILKDKLELLEKTEMPFTISLSELAQVRSIKS